MKKEKDPIIFLRHILESIERIEININRVVKNKFIKDVNLQDIIVRRLEIIGEAVRNIPDNFRERNKKIPWRNIAGMRDRLIHQYFDVDIELVWEIINRDIPKFKKQIIGLLKKLNK
jgi:uncharacterized protein with HEPN domain